MNRILLATSLVFGLALATGCKRESVEEKPSSTTERESPEVQGQTEGAAEGHAHDEVELGTVTIGGMKVSLAQGHGKVAASKEELEAWATLSEGPSCT